MIAAVVLQRVSIAHPTITWIATWIAASGCVGVVFLIFGFLLNRLEDFFARNRENNRKELTVWRAGEANYQRNLKAAALSGPWPLFDDSSVVVPFVRRSR